VRILVVDDDPFSLKLVMSILEKHSFDVVAATSARAALKELEKSTDFDLIISDVMMPNVDGFALLRQLRIGGRLSRIPVVLCTALGDQESVEKGIALGIEGYLVKPITASVLIGKVNSVLEKTRASILVVTDDELARKRIAQILERDAFKVISSANGEEALQNVKKERVTLVLADIGLPGMNGFELLANIKEYSPEIPVILMSRQSKYTRDEVVGAGADDLIVRPFLNTEILLKVGQYYKREANAHTHCR